MSASLRDLRRKIKSIRGTQKITSAMQLVAASKMNRAIRRATEARTYSNLIGSLVCDLSSLIDATQEPFFAHRPVRQRLVCLITTNRGLAGSLNTVLIRSVFKFIAGAEAQGESVRVVAVGAKGRQYLLRFAKERLVGDFLAPEAIPTFADASPIAQLLIDEFVAGRADRVDLAYNHFVSTLRQEPTIIPYLPFAPDTIPPKEKFSHTLETKGDRLNEGGEARTIDMLFEPSREEILHRLIPRALRVRLYQTLLETYASEQSARMLAMKNATDNAGDLLEDLDLTYNGLRQAGITSELLDIAAGAAALAS